MEIKLYLRGHVYSLCIGHVTPWFEQIPWIMFIEEFYDDKDSMLPTYAKVIFNS